jgi:putative N6-adenine-specific DNA methylase
MERLFAVSAPGLERYTALELERLGLHFKAENEQNSEYKNSLDKNVNETGGVSFEGDLRTIYLTNLHLRTASRVLVRLGEFYAAAFSELRKKAGRLPWEHFLKPDQPISIHVTCHRSRLYHSDAVAERIAGAIGDRSGQPPLITNTDPDQEGADTAQTPPAQLILARLVRDFCTISIDTSGNLLHKRGYRLASAKAPLRETLAAGLVMASGWDGKSPFIDPFCGSGTIAIEAALIARAIAPGRMRRFAFMDWQSFDSQQWETLLEENSQQIERKKLGSQETPAIMASDRDAGAIKIAQANAMRGKVEEQIMFSCQPVSAIEPSGVGWVVTNPPYGVRIRSNKDLRNLYAQFGNTLREKCPHWQVTVLCSDRQLLGNIGLKLDTSQSLVNGGITARIARGVVEV